MRAKPVLLPSLTPDTITCSTMQALCCARPQTQQGPATYSQWKVLYEASCVGEYVVELEPAAGTLVGTSNTHTPVGVHLAVSLRDNLGVGGRYNQVGIGCKQQDNWCVEGGAGERRGVGV